ncbi:MAG TPA: NADH-quinone oxidoreductase subunit C [Candidatus Dormibacteraeota bacterium]|nr:NADH-quinone oxidoreductase subunit C [Candidatus Dormibacteraeota bacterium]
MKLPEDILDHGVIAGDEHLTVARDRIRETLETLKAQGYESYVFMTCVDHLATPVVERPPERFELVYQLRNMRTHHELRVRVFVPEDDPRVPSVHDLYGPANWDERETWDLFGIVFEGHPNLTRILMPDDWVGHPLRRDYPVGGEPVDFSEDHETWQSTPPEA